MSCKHILLYCHQNFTDRGYLSQADSEILNRLNILNKLTENPIDFREVIRIMARETAHNYYHCAALKFSRETNDNKLRDALKTRIEKIYQNIEQECIE
jgi:hypothetical protein